MEGKDDAHPGESGMRAGPRGLEYGSEAGGDEIIGPQKVWPKGTVGRMWSGGRGGGGCSNSGRCRGGDQ